MKLINSIQNESSILLEMPHSGVCGVDCRFDTVPSIIKNNLRVSDAVYRTINFGCDVAVPLMSGFASLIDELPVSGLINYFARSLTDPNRDVNDVSGLVLQGREKDVHNSGVLVGQTVPMQVDFSDSHAMYRQATELFESMYKRPFTKGEFDEVLSYVYRPYHQEIAEHHSRINDRHGVSIHLSLHSLPPANVGMVNGGYVLGAIAKRGSLDLEKGILPDIILIHNDYKAANSDIVNTIRYAFEESGLIVSDGAGPFIGSNGVTGMYGNPTLGVNVVGIEHVTHNIEPVRHIGGLKVNRRKAFNMQKAYRKVVLDLLKL